MKEITTMATNTSNTKSPAAQAAPSIKLTEYLTDYLSSPTAASSMRRNVRTWFLGNIEGWDERAGSNLATQIAEFELLDDFLASLTESIVVGKGIGV